MLPDQDEVKAQLERPLLSVSAPGLVAAVCDRSGICWSYQRGSARCERDEPVGLSTSFSIASVTKTFTAMAVLMLRDQGIVRLDASLEAWLPEARALRYPTEDSARISLRHLLTHTSGLPRGVREARRKLGRDLTTAEILAALDGLSLEFSPGADRRYSNLGFALLGIVVSRAGGVDLRPWIQREILASLQLNETSWTADASPSLAAPHRLVDTRWRAGRPEVVDSYAPVSGLYSSVSDLCRYVGFHLRAWPPRDGVSEGPLSRASVRESHLAAGFQVAGERMKGLGWGLLDDVRLGHVVYHAGGTPIGYSASVAFLPASGVGAVALANAEVDLERPLLAVLGAYSSLRLLRRAEVCDVVRGLVQAAAQRDEERLRQLLVAGPDAERLARRLREAFERHGADGVAPQLAPVRLVSDDTACFHLRLGPRVFELALRPSGGIYRVVDVRALAARTLSPTGAAD